jgi:hypothetical protein
MVALTKRERVGCRYGLVQEISMTTTRFILGSIMAAGLAGGCIVGDGLDSLSAESNAAQVARQVDDFRAQLGEPNNGVVPGAFATGRREINWDAVPAAVTNIDTFPAGFFNSNSPRGALLSTPGSGTRISDNDFADINPSYAGQFEAFSPVKTFAAIGSNQMDVTFRVPGTAEIATVTGFGAVFCDVDHTTSSIEFFNVRGDLIAVAAPKKGKESVAFAGAVFDTAIIARVRLTLGDGPIGPGAFDVKDGGSQDLVVVDDFLYGEPQGTGVFQ